MKQLKPLPPLHWLLIFALPVVLIIVAMKFFLVNTLLRDPLMFIWLYEKAMAGDLLGVLQELPIQHNHHRIVLPFLIYAVMFATGTFSVPASMAILICHVLINCWLLAILINQTAPNLPKSTKRNLFLVFWMASFSLSYSLQWSTGSGFAKTITWLLASLVMINKPGIRPLVGAVAFGWLASFNTANGLFLWPAYLPLAWLRDRSNRISRTAIWLINAGLVTWAYFAGFSWDKTNNPDLLTSVTSLTAGLKFFVMLLGAPWLPFPRLEAWILPVGVLFIAITLWVLYRSRQRNAPWSVAQLPWLCLLLYMFITAVIVTLGRELFGMYEIYLTKYHIVLAYWSGALLMLLALAAKPLKHVGRLALMVALYIFIIGMLRLPGWFDVYSSRMQGLACMEMVDLASDACLKRYVMQSTKNARGYMHAALQKADLLTPAPRPTPDMYQVGPYKSVGDITSMDIYDDMAILYGWAAGKDCYQTQHVLITYGPDRTLLAHAKPAWFRPDVFRLVGKCHIRTGFAVRLDLEQIAAIPPDVTLDVWEYFPVEQTVLPIILDVPRRRILK